jgi:hypothetical protein
MRSAFISALETSAKIEWCLFRTLTSLIPILTIGVCVVFLYHEGSYYGSVIFLILFLCIMIRSCLFLINSVLTEIIRHL